MPRIIEFETHSDSRGELIVVEKCIPFEIKRVFYMRDVPSDETRGNHALKTCHQVLIPIVGTFSVQVVERNVPGDKIYRLSNPACGLYLEPMIWLQLHRSIPGSICLVLASELYDADDYIHNFLEFLGIHDESLQLHQRTDTASIGQL